ncbi:MAG TPA: MerR family transcriptional regulator [Thermomicrobiales bacterium]|jgi:DNA-binding transcriptional MerR regulator|nr:MerR family transcriptional regulator [Thermomicrobiales bacterium]
MTSVTTWTVNELATLAGVSVRTLHHYHHIGLLAPARIGDNGYRYYGRAELIRLQQILFFRELEFPLDRIRSLLDQPDLDAAAAYRDHRRLLLVRRDQLDGLIATLDRELGHDITEETTMPTDTPYRSPSDRFSDDELADLRAEAKERWGGTDGWRQSEAKAAQVTPERAAEIQRQMDDALFRIVAHMDEGVAAPTVQAAVADYRAWMGNYYEPTDEVFGHIARMYVDDDRFAETFRRYHPDLPPFIRDAILHSLGER